MLLTIRVLILGNEFQEVRRFHKKTKDNLKKQFGEMVYNLSQFATSNRRMAELNIGVNTWEDFEDEDESW